MRWLKYGDPMHVERPWRVGPCVALVDDDGTQCGRKHYAKGYCRSHYMRMFHGKPVDGAIGSRGVPADPPRMCEAEGCQEPHLTHGYCLAHYQRWLAKGHPELDRRFYDGCSVEGCKSPHYVRGHCTSHWWRLERYGDPLHPGGAAFVKADPAYVYVIRHDKFGAIKVGVAMAGAGQDRLTRHQLFGWTLVRRVDVATGADALAIEDSILELWQDHRGFLTSDDMPQGGWTETIPIDAYDDAAVSGLLAAADSVVTDDLRQAATGS